MGEATVVSSSTTTPVILDESTMSSNTSSLEKNKDFRPQIFLKNSEERFWCRVTKVANIKIFISSLYWNFGCFFAVKFLWALSKNIFILSPIVQLQQSPRLRTRVSAFCHPFSIRRKMVKLWKTVINVRNCEHAFLFQISKVAIVYFTVNGVRDNI